MPKLDRRIAQCRHAPRSGVVVQAVIVTRCGEAHHQRLDHHHGTIDDDAKIDRAQ